MFETLGKLAGVNILFDPDFRDKNVDREPERRHLPGGAGPAHLRQPALLQGARPATRSSSCPSRRPSAASTTTCSCGPSTSRTPRSRRWRRSSRPPLGTAGQGGLEPDPRRHHRHRHRGPARRWPSASSTLNDKARGEVMVEVADPGGQPQPAQGLRHRARRTTRPPLTLRARRGAGDGDRHAQRARAPALVAQPVRLRGQHPVARSSPASCRPRPTSRILAAPRLRAAEGKKTALKIGTEVPVPVTTFTAAATGGAGSTFAPATSFQYRNVGVNLELTPR